MKSELRCEQARIEISARLDGEIDAVTLTVLDEHLATCADCRAYEERLRKVRRMVRLQASEEVPDLVAEIVERVRRETTSSRRTWIPQLRTGAIAAVAAALILLGATLPWRNDSPDVARAAEIVRQVRFAARDLSTYHARFSLTERGWHRAVPVRQFRAEVWFDAPESFRLEVRDDTRYPAAAWPRNEVQLVANSHRWWIREPSVCPTAALPACGPRSAEERTVLDRQPFDGNSRLPTDIAIPLETLASADGIEARGSSTILGREAQNVVLPYLHAVPLIDSLQAGGSWRPFHPLDRVAVWLDSETWFPLRFTVSAGTSPDRELWAERMGIEREAPGTVLFQARSLWFDEPQSFPAATFKAPKGGALQEGNFTTISFSEPSAIRPKATVGLEPYRAGVTSQGQTILSYTGGMTFLKVVDADRTGLAAAYSGPGEVVRLGSVGEGLYQPATATSGRRIDMFTPSQHVVVESNLPRQDLVSVARSLTVRARIPEHVQTRGRVTFQRLDDATSALPEFALTPGWMPDGYSRSAALLTSSPSGRTLTLHYQRAEASFEGAGIRIVQAPSLGQLPPSSEEFVNVRIGDAVGRWSFERSELEWIADGSYRAIEVAVGDLSTALHIARALR